MDSTQGLDQQEILVRRTQQPRSNLPQQLLPLVRPIETTRKSNQSQDNSQGLEQYEAAVGATRPPDLVPMTDLIFCLLLDAKRALKQPGYTSVQINREDYQTTKKEGNTWARNLSKKTNQRSQINQQKGKSTYSERELTNYDFIMRFTTNLDLINVMGHSCVGTEAFVNI